MSLRSLGLTFALLTSVTCYGAGRKADAANPESSERVVASESGKLRVTARPSRVRQKQALDLTVTLTVAESSTQKPIDGLAWTVVPFMPSMGHGTSVVPEVHPLKNGVYEVEHANLFMPGSWELRATSSGAVSDKVTIVLDVVQ